MTIEDELVRWLKLRIAEEEAAQQKAAAGHSMTAYNRKVGAIEALRAVRAFVDPLGGDSASDNSRGA